MESPKAKKKREDAEYEAQLDALMWYIEHPDALEALKDETLKDFIRYMKKCAEEPDAGEHALERPNEGRDRRAS